MTIERVQERAAMHRATVDRQNGIIRGVKVLGPTSRNGREYTADALRKGVGLYENIRVGIGHLERHEARRYQDVIGRLENARVQTGGIYADLRFNPKHALAEQLAWDAEHAPGNVGLSHDVEGRIVRSNGRVMVEEIIAVRSVDLVADPATTGGLFEEEQAATFPGTAAFVGALRGCDVPGGTQAAFAESLRGATVAPEALSRFVNAIQE